jgi:hypothetical protein
MARLKNVMLEAGPEVLPAAAGIAGALGAAYYGKPPTIGATLGGAVGAIPYLLQETKKK